MKNRKLSSAIPFALLALSLAACSWLPSNSSGTSVSVGSESSYSADASGSETTLTSGSTSTVSTVPVSSSAVSDTSYSNESASGTINLADGAAVTDVASGVSINNSTNLITITSPGVFVITGSLSNGSILIDT